ncbi:MAG: hypothetical protein QXT73_04980 [Candidatus Methanomethylicaceae archaeon]
MGAFIERWYPLVGGIAVSSLYFLLCRQMALPTSIENLFSAVINISAIAVGFFATAKTILFSLSDRYVIRQLKKVGAFDTLIDYLLHAIKWCFLLAIITGLAFFIDFKTKPEWQTWALSFWLFLVWVALLSSYRVITILAKILRSID